MRVLWWLWTLLLFEQGGDGGLERQHSSEFFGLCQTFLLSEKRQWALLWLSYRAVTQIWQSVGCVRKFIFTHGKQGCVEERFSKERSKEHLEKSDKAGMSLSQPQRDETDHFYFCFLVSVIYVAVVASTFTLLKLLSSWIALWLPSFGKELSRFPLSGVMVLLLRKKHSLNFKMLT